MHTMSAWETDIAELPNKSNMELIKWQKVSLLNILYWIILEICEDGATFGPTERK